jgi:MYXO-CTERM domain-containing protein
MKSVLTFAAASLVAASTANATVITLDFEGLGNNTNIGNYYNGGVGPNYGVEFVGNALSLVAGSAGGSGNFTNSPSMPTIMYWLDGNNTIMNVQAGFTTGFATYYTSINSVGAISIYDGLNGTGNVLATLNLSALGSQAGGVYDTWALAGTAFDGVGKSVVFSGDANYMGFDDITFGSNVPAPGALAILGVAGAVSRRRRG